MGTLASSFTRPSPRLAGAAVVLAVVAAEVAVAVAFVRQPLTATALMAAGVAFAIALWRPVLVFAPAVVSLAFIPVYVSPSFGPLLLEPTACLLWVVAGAVALRGLARTDRVSLNVVDWAVLAFFALMTLPVLLGVQTPQDYLRIAVLWLGPYLGVRLYLAERRDALGFVVPFVVAAVAAVVLVVVEVATGSNVFLSLRGVGSSDDWAGLQERLGTNRAEGAWGHSIALAMFLATGVVAGLGLAMHGRSATGRWLAWMGAAALTVGLALTLSRTGWAVVATGVILLTFSAARGRGRSRLVGVVIATGALAVAGAAVLPAEVPSPLELAQGSQEVSRSTAYRQILLENALEDDALTLFGDPETNLASGMGTSIDNQYLLFAQDWGIVTLIGFLGIVLAAAVALVRRRGDALATILPVIALANLVGLAFVAFITQQQILVWLVIGACAAVAGRAARPAAG